MTSRGHSIVSSFQCILLTLLVLSVAQHARAEARLYLDRTTSEFVRVEEEAGEILSFEVLEPISEAMRFQLGDRQPAEVRSLGGGMTLVIQDVKGRGPLAEGLGMENADKDWALARVFRRSRSSGGYDAPYVPPDLTFLSRETYQWREDLEASFASGKLPDGKVVLDLLVPVPSEAAMRAAMLVMEDPSAAIEAIEECRAGGLEGDLFLAALELEAAAMANDAKRMAAALSTWDSRLRSSGSAVYVAMPDFFEEWLEGHCQDAAGRNVLPLWEELGRHAQAGDWAAIRETLARVPENGICFNHRATVLLNWRGLGARPTQFFSLVRPHVWGLVLADLVRGDFGAARKAMRELTYAASAMSHGAQEIIVSVIATAHRGTAAFLWRWLLLYSTLPHGEVAAAANDLRALVRADGEGLRNPAPFLDAAPGVSRVLPPNLVEARTRNRVAHTRLALLHAVAVARLHLEEKGSLPDSPWRFYDLLGDLSGDPWTEWEEPLLYLPMADRAVIYSRGPNGRDDGATVHYDPTNGSLSGGDLIELVLLHPPKGFPLPLGDRFHPRDIQRHLPNGINRPSFGQWNIGHVNSVPASIFCDGPIGFSHQHGKKLEGDLAGGHAVVEGHDGWYDLGPAAEIIEYDPTNGAISDGVIFIVRDGRAVR